MECFRLDKTEQRIQSRTTGSRLKQMRKTPTMHNYVCFYNSKQAAITANTSFEAYQKAAEQFKVPSKKQYMITVMLADVTHTPDF